MPSLASLEVRVAFVTLTASMAYALAGCTTPTLESTVEVPDQYVAAKQSEARPEVAWWKNFHDPVLSELIDRAAVENRDVKLAAERLRAARAGAVISRSRLMPSISGVAGYSDQRTGYEGPVTEKIPDTRAGTGGLAVAWEIDLAGGLRAGARAGESDALAA
jgi:multidrug efflux system outer membrane protein